MYVNTEKLEIIWNFFDTNVSENQNENSVCDETLNEEKKNLLPNFYGEHVFSTYV